jgi:hypothetical protein
LSAAAQAARRKRPQVDMNDTKQHSNGNGFGWRWWPFWRRAHESDDSAPYRRLALQLHYDLCRPDNPRSVLLVTPNPSRLCAYGSATLACCLADELRRPILLVDACPAAPEASRMLGSAAIRGFSDLLLTPSLPWDDLVLPTSHENVWFLPAGATVGPSQAAPPEHIVAVLKAAEARYDFVLVCGGSVLSNTMALAVVPYVGCVLLLAIENQTRVEDLDAAQETLQFCKASKVGLVFTTILRGGR